MAIISIPFAVALIHILASRAIGVSRTPARVAGIALTIGGANRIHTGRYPVADDGSASTFVLIITGWYGSVVIDAGPGIRAAALSVIGSALVDIGAEGNGPHIIRAGIEGCISTFAVIGRALVDVGAGFAAF